MTGVGQEREITNHNGTTTKLNVICLEAQDGHKIQCTLFGPYVDELNTFLGSGDANNVVVIMQFAKVKNFQDKIHIQNCMNCSKVIFNSNTAECVALRTSLAQNGDASSPITLTQISLESRVSPVDDFLYNTPRTTLQSLKDATTESSHVVCATVKRILNPDSFWYTACVCNKAVVPDSKMFFCEKCNKHVTRVFPRFCLKVRVIDNTDSATFVIFDKDASLLFDISCADMIQQMENNSKKPTSVGVILPQLEGIVDKSWLFKVESKPNHNRKYEQSFRVRKICTDAAIIKQFKDKWETEEAAVGKTINECGSLSTLVEKGKDLLIGGSSNVLSEDFESLSGNDIKGNGTIIIGTPSKYTQDLMNKFADAVVDLDNESVQTIGSSKTVSVESQNTPVSTSVSEESATPRLNGQRKKSLAKRVSPTIDEDQAYENAPIKLLKRAVKIEKNP